MTKSQIIANLEAAAAAMARRPVSAKDSNLIYNARRVISVTLADRDTPAKRRVLTAIGRGDYRRAVKLAENL